jgi:acyl-homoserine-lactone acylase
MFTKASASVVVAVIGVGVAVTTVSSADAAAPRGYSATIRYTEYGVPHVLAGDYPGLGFGEGYAAGRDNLCAIANGVVTLGGERSRFHGPDASPAGDPATGSSLSAATTNLSSDLYFRGINGTGVVERLVAQPAPLGPRAELRDMVRGYVVGFNRYLREGHPSSCRGAPWLRPMTELDVYRRTYAWALVFGQSTAADAVTAAQPPGPSTVDKPATGRPSPSTIASDPTDRVNGIGSNAIAVGVKATANGRGLLLGNPHLGWHGDARLWQVQLTIPGRLNVSGAAALGLPTPLVGHTETVAWSGTASAAVPYTLFELALVPGEPTTYLVDGRPEPMRRRDVSVTARQPDGSLATITKPQWWTRYGPVVSPRAAGLDLSWTATTAYVLADANTQNMRLGNLLFAVNHAASTEDVLRSLRETQGSSNFNFLAADAWGVAAYADIQVVPHVTDEHAARCNTALGRTTFRDGGLAVLDGSRSDCVWGRDADAVQPGTFGPHRLPVLRTGDYVANSNESHWLANADRLLTGFPRILGPEATERFPRTRSTFTVIEDQLAHGTFTRSAMQELMLANRNYAAELVVPGTLEICGGVATDSKGNRVDLAAACRVLAGWDLRNDTTSRGALLFDAYWNNVTTTFRPPQWGPLWRVPFDPADPVHTPRTLNTDRPELPVALADAVTMMTARGIPLDAPLGDYQYVVRNGERIPIGGGSGRTGVVNNIEAVRRDPAEVRWGSSYTFVTAFDGDRCPDTATLMTYSQSADPTSPHHRDQTELFSRKAWVTERFCEKDILASPSVTTLRIEQR